MEVQVVETFPTTCAAGLASLYALHNLSNCASRIDQASLPLSTDLYAFGRGLYNFITVFLDLPRHQPTSLVTLVPIVLATLVPNAGRLGIGEAAVVQDSTTAGWSGRYRT